MRYTNPRLLYFTLLLYRYYYQTARYGNVALTLYGVTFNLQSDGPLYRNMVTGTLDVDGWAVTFGTARWGLGGLRPRPVPSSLYQM